MYSSISTTTAKNHMQPCSVGVRWHKLHPCGKAHGGG